MKIFTPLYEKVIQWSEHKHAKFYLYFTAFIESIFWPIPVDIMLAPMVLAKKESAWYYAFGATIFSVLGGMVGYYVGQSLYDPIVLPFIEIMHYQSKVTTATEWLVEWGVLFIFVGSFTPIPFKVFTVVAGMISIGFLPFTLTALVGRGLRFFLVSAIMVIWGEKMESKLKKYIDNIGWFVIFLLVLFYLIMRFK